MMKNFKTNLSLKILSLVIAIITWAVLMNIINPLVNGFVSVPIETINDSYVLEQNKTYTIHNSRMARVTYIVKTDMQTNIRQNDFKVYIDLNDLAGGEFIPLRFEALNGVDSYISNVQVDPMSVRVTVDDMSRNEFRVQHEIRGDVGYGHSIGNVILSPNIVYISGSNALIDSIDKVSIDIPVKNNEETFSGTALAKVYDKEGKLIPNDSFVLSSEEISYSVVVNSRASISLNAVVEGNVKNGYSYAGAQVYPNTIMIDGPRSIIENIYTLDLPIINIEGLSSNKEFRYQTSDILPIGITSNTGEIVVNIVVNDNVLNRPVEDRENAGPHVEESETTGEEETEE